MKLVQTDILSFLFTGSIIYVFEYHNCLYQGMSYTGGDIVLETGMYTQFLEARDEIMELTKEFVKQKSMKVS